MDSKTTYIDEYVGLWCELKLVTGEQLEGLIYSYHEDLSLLVLLKDLSNKASGRVINTEYIESFAVKEVEATEEGLPDKLEAYCTLPSMIGGKAKPLMKNANSSIKDAEHTRKTNLAFVADSTCIGALDVLVPLQRIYPGIAWEAETQSIKCSPLVYVQGDPTWASPEVIIRSPDKMLRDDSMLADRVRDALKNLSK